MAFKRKSLSLLDLLKLQTQGLENLDIETMRRLAPVLDQAQSELQTELNRFSEDQFSYQHRLQTIRQINRALNKIYLDTAEQMEIAGEEYSQFGHEMAQREVKNLNRQVGISTPNISRDVTSLEHNDFLINNALASLQTYTVGVRQQVSNALTQGVLQRKSGYEITGRISSFMEDMRRWRIQRIVRTEMSRIYNSTKLVAYGEFRKEHFPDLMKRLYHPMDSRTADDSKALKRLDPAVPLDKPFVFKYKGDKRVFLSPPDRSNDRSVLVPYRKKWKQ